MPDEQQDEDELGLTWTQPNGETFARKAKPHSRWNDRLHEQRGVERSPGQRWSERPQGGRRETRVSKNASTVYGGTYTRARTKEVMMRTCPACGTRSTRSEMRFCTHCGSPFPVSSNSPRAPIPSHPDSFPTSFTSNGVRWTLHKTRKGLGVYRSSLGEAELSVTSAQAAMDGTSPLVEAPQDQTTSGDLIRGGCSLFFVLPLLLIGLGLFPLIGGSFWGGAGVAVGVAIDAVIVWVGWNVYRSSN